MRGPAAQLVLELLCERARRLWAIPDDPINMEAWFPPRRPYPSPSIATLNAAYDDLIADIRRRRQQAAGPRIRYWGENWIEIVPTATKKARVAQYIREVGTTTLTPYAREARWLWWDIREISEACEAAA